MTYGCDTFDSCYPTRVGRHGTMLTKDGPLRVVSLLVCWLGFGTGSSASEPAACCWRAAGLLPLAVGAVPPTWCKLWRWPWRCGAADVAAAVIATVLRRHFPACRSAGSTRRRSARRWRAAPATPAAPTGTWGQQACCSRDDRPCSALLLAWLCARTWSLALLLLAWRQASAPARPPSCAGPPVPAD